MVFDLRKHTFLLPGGERGGNVVGRYAPTEKPEALESRIVELLSDNA